MIPSSYLPRLLTLCLLVSGWLSSPAALAQTKSTSAPKLVATPQPTLQQLPPGEGGTVQITLNGPSQVCVNTPATFTSLGSGCSYWSWDAGGGTQSQTDSYGRSTAVITWSQPGTYTVAAEAFCETNSSPASRTVTVVAPPAPQPITSIGYASQTSASGATICTGNTLELVPPAGSSAWAWTGTGVPNPTPQTNGNVVVAPTASATTYTVTYTTASSPCRLSSSFTVRVVPYAWGTVVVENAERYGPGSVSLSIKDANPGYLYTWYGDDNASNTTVLAQGPTYVPTVTGTRDYYVTTTSCSTGPREKVSVTVRQVRITVGGAVPTAPIRLTYGTPLELQAQTTPTSGGPFTWLLNGRVLPGQTEAKLTATLAGAYTVRIPGTGASYESSPVTVLDPLAEQTANGQALSFVNSVRVLQQGVQSTDQVAGLSAADRSQTVTYLNGLGQPLQQIAVQAGPDQQDVVQHLAYAGAATSAQSYLPVPVTAQSKGAGMYEADPLTQLNAYYGSKGGQPYATTTLEASPLARPLEQTQTGTAWAGHANQISYQANGTQEVRRWQGDDGSQWYAAGQLRKEVLTDADNRQTEVFKDLLDRVVLQRKVTVTGSTRKTYDTYPVYAEAGYVQRIIPPAAVEALAPAGWNLQNLLPADREQFIKQWLYEYTYDNRGRMVERKFPGAKPIYLVYDAFDRPILVQDGTHRDAQQWLFTKFDAQNRPVVEGIYNRTIERQLLQNEADAATQSAEFETRTNTGYTTTATFPAVQDGSTGTLLSLTFYDDYDVDLNGLPDYESQAVDTEPRPDATEQLRGLTTVVRRRVLAPGGQAGTWLTTALFYDQYGNLVQKQSNNLLLPGSALTDITTLVYREKGFVPQVLRTVKTQQTGLGLPVVVRNRYRYDAAGRLLQAWQQHQYKGQWEPEVLLATNRYEGLGELTQKKLHSRDGGTTFLQTEDFAYNLHGQLTGINQSNLADKRENDLFGMALIREQTSTNVNTPRFDGGISAVRWSSYNPDQPTQTQRENAYVYTYDGLGQLTDATFSNRVTSGTSWEGYEKGAYDEKGITYDANGNIKTLQRYTKASPTSPTVLMDNLEFTHVGNQLIKADEKGMGDITRGFRDVKMATEYSYDSNGSLLRDENKGISYNYNTLNKVERQTVGSSSISYTYDATGTVLKKEVVKAAGTTTEYYVDGLVYEVSPGFTGLRSVPTPEGRALVKDAGATQLTYEYHLRDHMGNLRVAFRAEQTQVERKLAWEDPEAPFSGFENVTPSRVTSDPARPGVPVSYHGPNGPSPSAASAGVTTSKPGPFTRVPVVHGSPVKVSLYYMTPNGEQFLQAAEPPVSTLQRLAPVVALAPSLVPLSSPTPTELAPAKQRVAPGLQLSVTGLLSGLWLQQRTAKREPATQGVASTTLTAKPAYVEYRLYNEQNVLVSTDTKLAPVVASGGWDKLRFTITPDLSAYASRTGYLEVQLLNDGGLPVYYDSLTVRYPQDKVVVTQENHYYPFGMNMSGVAVNTNPALNISKEQFNGGSTLEDELLGSEAGIYSTFFRTYDPTIGRFQGVDPLADQFSDLSSYHFSNNDPVNYNDPSGALSDAGPGILRWISDWFHPNGYTDHSQPMNGSAAGGATSGATGNGNAGGYTGSGLGVSISYGSSSFGGSGFSSSGDQGPGGGGKGGGGTRTTPTSKPARALVPAAIPVPSPGPTWGPITRWGSTVLEGGAVVGLNALLFATLPFALTGDTRRRDEETYVQMWRNVSEEEYDSYVRKGFNFGVPIGGFGGKLFWAVPPVPNWLDNSTFSGPYTIQIAVPRSIIGKNRLVQEKLIGDDKNGMLVPAYLVLPTNINIFNKAKIHIGIKKEY